ncbi:hypothetical protein DRO66_05565 [Candidatus Bathyarchaeota archaeon]|nr:MAG: hypothetical protein DRO66_05565 [Candidatus Bathyarchaeota archaeon]
MRPLVPYSDPNFSKQVEFVLCQSLGACHSGEFTADDLNAPLGVPKKAGKIGNIFLSCEQSGKDDSATLSFTCDVRINAVSCLTTPPAIAHVSGEVSQQKTTVVAGDTGITQAVVNRAADTFNPGDIITYDLVITRTSSPTTEIRTPCIVVELEPHSPSY